MSQSHLNSTSSTELTGLTADLLAFRALCEDTLDLATRENQALSHQTDYQPEEFSRKRKALIPGLESVLLNLRGRRQSGQQPSWLGASSEQLRSLVQSIQNLLMKVLLLDRENHQALLRRGLLPLAHWPSAGLCRPVVCSSGTAGPGVFSGLVSPAHSVPATLAGTQRPHYVAGLYRRHSGI